MEATSAGKAANSGQAGQLDVSGLLSSIRSKDPTTALVIQQTVDGVNRLAVNSASSAVGDIAALNLLIVSP